MRALSDLSVEELHRMVDTQVGILGTLEEVTSGGRPDVVRVRSASGGSLYCSLRGVVLLSDTEEEKMEGTRTLKTEAGTFTATAQLVTPLRTFLRELGMEEEAVQAVWREVYHSEVDSPIGMALLNEVLERWGRCVPPSLRTWCFILDNE